VFTFPQKLDQALSVFFSQKPDKIILEPSTETSYAFFLYVTESAQNFMFPPRVYKLCFLISAEPRLDVNFILFKRQKKFFFAKFKYGYPNNSEFDAGFEQLRKM
jgi:hypothetical protein